MKLSSVIPWALLLSTGKAWPPAPCPQASLLPVQLEILCSSFFAQEEGLQAALLQGDGTLSLAWRRRVQQHGHDPGLSI